MIGSNNNRRISYSTQEALEKRQDLAMTRNTSQTIQKTTRRRGDKGSKTPFIAGSTTSTHKNRGSDKGDKGVNALIAHVGARSLSGRARLIITKLGLAPCHPCHPCQRQGGEA